MRASGAGLRDPANGSECCEIIINGVLKENCDASEEIINEIAFAALNKILPSLERRSVVGIRMLRPRGSFERQIEEPGNSLVWGSEALPSCVVRLESHQLVRKVMEAKRALTNNYMTTNDHSLELLGPIIAAYVTKRKIFINEMLPHAQFQLFKSLKPIAQGLGFKYIWHRGDNFLVKRRGGERAHVFSSAADLQAIKGAYLAVPSNHQQSRGKNTISNGKNQPSTVSRPETAQAHRSTATSWLDLEASDGRRDRSFLKAGFLIVNY